MPILNNKRVGQMVCTHYEPGAAAKLQQAIARHQKECGGEPKIVQTVRKGNKVSAQVNFYKKTWISLPNGVDL